MTFRPLFRRMKRFFGLRSVQITLAAILLALVIWFVTPLIAFGDLRPFDSAAVRLSCLLVLVLIWGAAGHYLRTRRSSEEAAIISAMRRSQEEADAAIERDHALEEEQLSAFQDAANDALRSLRRKRGRGFLRSVRHSMPWYLVLGEDGAGKTSLLQNSGLYGQLHDHEPAGAGSGRFYVADEAVFVEISGRLFDPQEKSIPDLLKRILDHLRRLKSRQPINGILLTIDAEKLLTNQEADLLDYASRLRRHLDEVLSQLRCHAPVYLTITKLDRIVGFEEFFEALNIEERAAVFGLAIAATPKNGTESGLDLFRKRFSSLVEGLAQQQFQRLQDEPDELDRRRIFEFPNQFALLETRLAAIMRQLTGSQRFGRAPNVSGIFFTSAKQPGDVSDLLAAPLAPQFGQTTERMALAADGAVRRGNPFFIQGLFRDVMLPEAHVSGLTPPARLFAHGRDIAANTLLFIAAFALLAFLLAGLTEGRGYKTRLMEQASAVKSGIAATTADGSLPTSFRPVLDVLDDLRAISEERPGAPTLGLYNTATVEDASQEAYHRALESMLFPYVWSYLKEGLGAPFTDAGLRFQQLKLYLMLTGEKPVDADTARRLGSDFSANWLLDERSNEADNRIAEHLAALATVQIKAPDADLALIDKARSQISDYTLARLAYDMALALPEARGLALWRPVDHMSLSGPEALIRFSGASLWDGIPGIYTKAGLENVLNVSARPVAETLADDLWVMGKPADSGSVDRETARIREGMLDLYRVDYIREWDGLLADLAIVEGSTAADVARAIAILTGDPSPMKELLTAIAAETDLEPASAKALAAAGAALAAPLTQITSTLSPRRVVNVAKSVSDHFRSLREMVIAAEGQQARVDAMLAALAPLYAKVNHVATGGDALELGAEPQTLLGAFHGQVAELAPQLQPLFSRIHGQVSSVLSGSSRERLSQIWSSTILPSCIAATEGRFPFDPKSAEDASIEDFARVFGPKGAIAAFRDTYLKPFIDSTSKPWKWRKGQQAGLAFDNTVLAQMEQASDITTIYFGDQETPAVRFTLRPVAMDARARAMQLDFGGSTLVYAHGPPADTPLKWPADDTGTAVALSMTPEIEGQRNSVSRTGAWGLFRLLQLGRVVEKEPTDIVSYRFAVGKRRLTLQLTAPVTRNPFAQDILSEFKCPVL